jgi:hypothetical protein
VNCRFGWPLDLVEISLQVPLKNPLKTPEHAKLIEAFVQGFRKSGIEEVVIKGSWFIDQRSGIDPMEGGLHLVVKLGVSGAAVQIIEALGSLVEDGKQSSKELGVLVDSKCVVDGEGNLIADNEISKMIWESRNFIQPELVTEGSRVALAFGSAIYPMWSSEPMPVVITVNNPSIISDVMAGKSRGVVPQIRVKWFSCSICNENVDGCDHEIGREYEKKCVAIPRDVQFLEESLSDKALDPRCRVTDLFVIGRKETACEWYGYQGSDTVSRLKRINDCLKDGIVTKEAAEKFRLYFSKRSVGHCKFKSGGDRASIRARAASRRKAARA